MTTLKERITEDMKAAMRASEKERLSTIRMVQAAIKQREVDERIVLDDAQVIAVLEKMVKQRREAIAATGAASVKDMGKVMGAVKAKAAGRADMGVVSARIKAALSG